MNCDISVYTAWSMARMVLDRSNTEILGWNSVRVMDVRSRFLCCVVLCRQRLCDELIPHPKRLTKYFKGFTASEVNF
jgi:hypothetical protein